MKKIVLIIFLNVFFGNISFADENIFAQYLKEDNFKIKNNKEFIVRDDFVLATLDKNLKIKKQPQIYIKDEFVENTIAKDPKIKAKIENNKNRKVRYDCMRTSVMEISPKEYYTTKSNLQEGEYIDFVLANDFKYKNKTYPKGAPIKARVENINQNGIYGLPSELVLGNFVLANNLKLDAELSARGANRSIWIYPVARTFSVLLYNSGIIFMPIRGGHVRLKPEKTYEVEVYY